MRILPLIGGCTISLAAHAGDYELYVWSKSPSECLSKPLHAECNTSSDHACSAAEVSGDLKRYFAGMEPTIGSLVASFSNGHVSFCSDEAKVTVARALHEVEANKRGRQLRDFINVNKL
jgi:hypothetical protein